jgi:hypothetical protein
MFPLLGHATIHTPHKPGALTLTHTFCAHTRNPTFIFQPAFIFFHSHPCRSLLANAV